MNHIFFIHSSVDGHLGCFHVLAIVNSAVVNIGLHVRLLLFEGKNIKEFVVIFNFHSHFDTLNWIKRHFPFTGSLTEFQRWCYPATYLSFSSILLPVHFPKGKNIFEIVLPKLITIFWIGNTCIWYKNSTVKWIYNEKQVSFPWIPATQFPSVGKTTNTSLFILSETFHALMNRYLYVCLCFTQWVAWTEEPGRLQSMGSPE